MSDELTWDGLHDATLESIEVCPGAEQAFSKVTIAATGARGLDCPRLEAWGPSESINQVVAPAPLPEGVGKRLEIEMQSGDVIKVEADSFVLVAVPGLEPGAAC